MYQIIIKKAAKKFIDGLPAKEKRRIVNAIELLPNGEDIKRLKGHDELLRLRVGPYRVIYTVDNGKLIIYVSLMRAAGEIYTKGTDSQTKTTVLLDTANKDGFLF